MEIKASGRSVRLTEKGRALGLVDDRRWAAFSEKREAIELEKQRLREMLQEKLRRDTLRNKPRD